jgi:sirohydrochlorin cobaltochelatase
MKSRGNEAVVLVAYGSLHPNALPTYEKIKRFYQHQLPGYEVLLAFTSNFIRHRLKEQDNNFVHNPLTALAELQDLGYSDVIVQSLQIVPGEEFHQIMSLVQCLGCIQGRFSFRNLAVGLPLLAGLSDCRKVSAILKSIFERATLMEDIIELPRDPERTAVVLVGHGTSHPGENLYSMLSFVLRNEHENVFLGTLDGYLGIDRLLPELERSGARKIRLIPLLLVAGGHAWEDMAGDNPRSWKTILERNGFQSDSCLLGLGECEDILKIFLEHSRIAFCRLGEG